MRLRELAREVDVDPAYLSRILNYRDPKTLPLGLIENLQKALDFPDQSSLIDAIRARQASL